MLSNEEILELDITPNQYFIAWCIHEQRKDLFEKLLQIDNEDKVKNDLWKLSRKEYINCELCEVNTFDFSLMKVQKLFDKKTENTFNFHTFASQLYDLFPKGIKSGGYPVRSGFSDFEKKLKKYIDTHKEHNVDIIRKAFELYIEQSRRNNWQFMKLAGYFILKDGVSTLESLCEEVINKPEIDEQRKDIFTRDL